MPDENLSFLWNLLSQSGIRERRDRKARLALDFFVLGQEGSGTTAFLPPSTWAVFAPGRWACGMYILTQGKDTLKTKVPKKPHKTPLIQSNVIGGENYGMKKIHPALCLVHNIYLNYISWIKIWISCDSKYLIYVCLKSQGGHSGIVTFPSSSHSMAPPAHSCSLLSYNT